MTLAVVITKNDPETAHNALRLAAYCQSVGDTVSLFLLGAGVEIEGLSNADFDVLQKARAFHHEGGEILACGTCLERRGLGTSDLYQIATIADLRNLIDQSERVVTF